ncbi:methyltransferase, FkbM family [Roseibium album]|nr:methyltransferase, FkbM family [Roseibium album]
MLTDFVQKIAYKIRRKIQPGTIVIDDIKVTAELDYIPFGIRKQLYQKNYEKGELTLVRRALRPDDRVLEVGAGIGFISLACAKICGPENVLSYEPNPAMKRVIEKNYALNGLIPNLRNKVLSVEAGEVEFYFSDNVLSSSLIDRKHGDATKVQADAISEVVNEYDPTAIVMDVEGAEIELLRNCNLSNISKIMIEMHPHIVGMEQIEALSQYLIDNGFKLEEQLGKRYLLLK